MLLWYTFGPNLTTYRTFHILIEAQQFLSFLAPEKLSLLIFLNFLGFGDFEPQVSYKSFLIKKNKCTCIQSQACQPVLVSKTFVGGPG